MPGQPQPIFNVPGAVLALLVVMTLIHLVRTELLSPDADLELLLTLAFIPARFAEVGAELPGGQWVRVTSFLTHAFVHGSAAHLFLNGIWLLAFGGAIARRIGTLRFLAFFAVTAAFGAALFLFLNWGLLAPMVGASGAVAGLMGAAIRLIMPAIAARELWKFRIAPQSLTLLPLADALRNREILFATAIWLALNALAVLGLGSENAPGPIAWEAHIGGYLAGLLLFGCFDVQMRNNDTK